MKMYPIQLKGQNLKIGIVQARFSEGIGGILLRSCIKQLLDLKVKEKNIILVTVPGALEIPIALQNLLVSEDCDALIALGVVVRGETYHFKLVSNESASCVSRIALDFNVPIANGILTTENEYQAIVRAEDKGIEVAKVAVEMANHVKNLQRQKKINIEE